MGASWFWMGAFGGIRFAGTIWKLFLKTPVVARFVTLQASLHVLSSNEVMTNRASTVPFLFLLGYQYM